MKIINQFLLSFAALTLVACSDDITNVHEANQSEKLKAQSFQEKASASLRIKEEVSLPLLSSGIELSSEVGTCELATGLLVETLTVPKDTNVQLALSSVRLSGDYDQLLITNFGAPANDQFSSLNCELSSDFVELNGLQAALDSFSSEDAVLKVQKRKVATRLISEIIFSKEDAELPKLIANITLKNKNLGECNIRFHNLQEAEVIFPSKATVVSDSLNYASDYSKKPYFRYSAKFTNRNLKEMICQLKMESSEKLKVTLAEFFSSEATKAADISYH